MDRCSSARLAYLLIPYAAGHQLTVAPIAIKPAFHFHDGGIPTPPNTSFPPPPLYSADDFTYTGSPSIFKICFSNSQTNNMSLQVPHRPKANGDSHGATKAVILVRLT